MIRIAWSRSYTLKRLLENLAVIFDKTERIYVNGLGSPLGTLFIFCLEGRILANVSEFTLEISNYVVRLSRAFIGLRKQEKFKINKGELQFFWIKIFHTA